jgi:hypothetical protein
MGQRFAVLKTVDRGDLDEAHSACSFASGVTDPELEEIADQDGNQLTFAPFGALC